MRRLFVNEFINCSSVILILRILLGVVFFAHGAQKLLGWFGGRGFTTTIENWSANMNIPVFFGYLGIFAEFFGGIAVLIGLLTRISSFGIAVVMSVAILKVNLSGGFFNPGGFEYPLTLFIIAIIIFLYGPGKYSLDDKLFSGTRV